MLHLARSFVCFALFAPLTLAAPQELQLVPQGAGTLIVDGAGNTLHASAVEITSARWIEAGTTQVVHWTERAPSGAERDRYRVAFEGGALSRTRTARYELQLKRQRFDPLAGAPEFTDSPLSAGGKVYIVQFKTQSLTAYRDELERLGATVWNFLPYQAHLVWLEPAAVEVVRALPFVRWVGSYHPEYRVEQFVRANLDSGALAADQQYNVQVFEKGPGQKALVAARIAALGGTVTANIPDGYLVQAALTPDQVRTVAGWNEVIWIDRWFAPELDMNLVRMDGGADFIEGVTGFTGQGVSGECMDGNVLKTHQDFQSNPIKIHGTTTGDASHGTSVTGVVFGDGTGDIAGRGLLPDGKPIFASYLTVGNRYAHTGQLMSAPYRAVFQTNSWGGGLTTDYTSESMQMDDILFDFDIVITQSQSNTGSQLSRPQAWAKNIVSVGGIRHQNTLTTADDNWNGAGSIGPAADGRIKPDLAYWYESIYTTSSNGAYTQFGGTSAATPITAGYFGLFFQLWHGGIFGNPTANNVFGSKPHATTARAFMINTAEQYPFSSGQDDLSRNKQGWGRANVANLYNLRDKFFWVDETDVLSNLQSVAYPLVVEAGEPAFKATMVYLDLPGTTSASLHRINDLTLKVTAPDGSLYWGNRSMKLGNWTKKNGNPNDKDVIECVFVQNPDAGTWLVEVLADEINVDSHVETGAVDADFGLVVSGTTGIDGGCTVPSSYCPGAPNSAGAGAVFSTTGTTSVAANDLVLDCASLPTGQFGLFFFGPSSQNVALGDGSLCVGGAIVRLPVLVSDALGQVSFSLDVTTLGGAIQAGDTRYFQFWYRDPFGPGGTGSNLSNGMQTTWCD
jgi:Subtilase family